VSDKYKPEENRQADIRIVRAEDNTYYRVDIKFLGYIAAAIRWDDRVPEAREEVKNLLRDAPDFIGSAFNEIDIENGSQNIDAEWEYYDERKSDPEPEPEEDEK
jgi:hypothetical protein